MSSHATLSAAADDRKARLAKLKSLKRKQPEDDDHQAEPTPDEPSAPRSHSPPEKDVARLYISGRNYDPETRGPKLGFESAPTMDRPTLEEQAAEVEAEVKEQAKEDEQNDKGIDLFKLQPKKPNWDLKRELEKKMEVLNVRTDNAIARLVRERLAAKQAATAGSSAGSATGDGSGDIDGTALVESLRLREQEEEEERRREKEAEDAV